MKKRCDIWVNSVVLVKFVLYVCLCSQSWGLTASWLMNERTITTSDVLYTSPFDDTTGIIIWATPSPRHFSLNINVIFIFFTVGWNNSGSDVTLYEQPTSIRRRCTDCSFCYLVYTGPETLFPMQCVPGALALTVKRTERKDDRSPSVYITPMCRTFGTLRPYSLYSITSRVPQLLLCTFNISPTSLTAKWSDSATFSS